MLDPIGELKYWKGEQLNQVDLFDLSKLQQGLIAYRLDWGFGKDVYLKLELNEFGTLVFNIYNTLTSIGISSMVYRLSYADINSDKWVYTLM